MLITGRKIFIEELKKKTFTTFEVVKICMQL